MKRLLKNESKRTVPLTQKSTYLMFIASMVLFGTIGTTSKFIPVSSGTIVTVRGILGALFLLIVISLRRKNDYESLGIKRAIIYLFIGFLMGVNWIVLFEAFNYTTVSTATMCYYMQPAFLILLSVLFLREKITKKKLICVFVSIVGMVLISGVLESSSASSTNYTGIALALLSGFMYAIVVILNKKFPTEDVLKKTIIQLIGATIIAIPYMLANEDFSSLELTTVQVLLLVMLGVIHTGLACAMYFIAVQKIPSSSMAILGYLDPATALVMSAVVLSEPFTLLGIIGAVLILGSAFVSER